MESYITSLTEEPQTREKVSWKQNAIKAYNLPSETKFPQLIET